MSEQHIAFMLSKIPMQRFVQVNEIAALIGWLASEDCSFSTGAVFDISGGRATTATTEPLGQIQQPVRRDVHRHAGRRLADARPMLVGPRDEGGAQAGGGRRGEVGECAATIMASCGARSRRPRPR